MYRKIGAWILLIILLVVPFINWRLGALLWMCAWVTYICQTIFDRKQSSMHDHGDNDDEK
jgi:hypothetical protein